MKKILIFILIAVLALVCVSCDSLFPSKHEHSFGEWKIKTPATCTEKEVQVRKCDCNEEDIREGAALGHDMQTKYDESYHWTECDREGCDEATEKVAHSGGTATETEKAVCTTCGQSYGALADHVHAFGEWTTLTPSTCTDAEVEERKCACGTVETREGDAALSHNIVPDAAVPATCITTGLTAGEHCTRCSYKIAQEVAEKLPHTPGADATCTSVQECTVCHTVLNPKLAHDYKTTVIAPTCEVGGYTTYTCSCGDSYVGDTVPATGHSYGDWTTKTPATCTKAEVEVRKCSCGSEETRTGDPALDHDMNTKYDESYHWTECDRNGCNEETEHKAHSGGTATETDKAVCTTCGQSYGALADHVHAYGDWTTKTPATCTKAEVEERKCACGIVETREGDPKLAHDYKTTMTAPTCEADGYTTYTCSCGDSYVGDTVPAAGHSYGDWTTKTPATCTKAEVEVRKCFCGKEETRTGDSALDHDMKTKYDESYHWTECDREGCNEETEHIAHSGGTATTGKRAKCTVCKQFYGELVNNTVTANGKIVQDTYISANNSNKDDSFYEATELFANNKNNYRPLFMLDVSELLVSEEFAERKDSAIVSITLRITTGSSSLLDASTTYNIYGFLPGEGVSDVDFADVTWNTNKSEGTYSKLYRNASNGNCVFLIQNAAYTDIQDVVTVFTRDGRTYVTYNLKYSDIEQFVCKEKGNCYGYIVMGFDFNTGIRFASMEDADDIDKPTLSITYAKDTSVAMDYYFDSKAGSGGDGTYENPYNSLDIISSLVITPGTHINLKRGSSFSGSLILKNISGTEDNPIVITSYGDGYKPKIDGNGLTGSGIVYIENCSYLTVENLEIYDSDTNEGDKRGVLIVCNGNGGEDVVTYNNIMLQNLYIHDITGLVSNSDSGEEGVAAKKTGGIQLWSTDGLGRVNGFTITGCTIDYVSNVGIATWYKPTDTVKISPYEEAFADKSHYNVWIYKNEISNVGKNAIFVRNLMGGVIEHNVVHDTAISVNGNSIVTSYVDGTVIQYNEGYNNNSEGNDGCMLDADLASKDTVWQYNYSHDNSFGLFIACTKSDENFHDKVIVRYNLSVNDRGELGIIYINYVSDGIYVYNNTIVTATDTKYVINVNDGTTSYFYNNLIYNRSANAEIYVGEAKEFKASHNLVYSASGSISGVDGFDADAITEDPIFAGDIPEESIIGTDELECYKLSEVSPALGVGYDTDKVCDFFGNEYKKSIGFYCGN